MSVLLSVVGAGATGLPTVIVCVVAAEQTSRSEKGTSETQIETSVFFFRNHFKMKSIWWILLFFFVVCKSLSDAVLWIICLERVNSLLSFL